MLCSYLCHRNTALMKFEIKSRDTGSSARTGNLITDHGEIHTPIFMPVGTAGTSKRCYEEGS